ncbi:MAG: glutamate--tRNA ligase [Clostridiales bacterium]|nr:glutamate--tRNA ligase [Clostridiales bacterium]
MDNEKLAELLFPDVTSVPDDMEKRYPPRTLPEGAKVTRFAPSPTGFMHLGNLYGALTDERLAHQSGGVFYLRIEDTDGKRTVENGVDLIIRALGQFDLKFDEGAASDGDNGAYGPYRQSERKEIYQTYAKQLVRDGKAYPCFCTEQELADIRAEQESEKLTPGYYGKWAVWRDAPEEKVLKALEENKPFVLRFRSEGSPENKVKFTDMIKGDIEVTENDIDHVLLKSDGIPTYHFAHAVDDHLMRTTHVVRDESWLSTLPFHIQLFRALGFRMPKYLHTAQVLKNDGGGKRKLSKRKDPEAALAFYHEKGYPSAAVKEYLMTLLNSNYEEWRTANPGVPLESFPFSAKKMSVSGCLFSFEKLDDISRSTIAAMSASEVFDGVCRWAEEYDPEFAATLKNDRSYAESILSVGRGGNKPRKDITVWSGVKQYMGFFYDRYFSVTDPLPEGHDKSDVRAVLDGFLLSYDPADDQQQWFEKIKAVGERNGYCPNMKEYRSSPEGWKGSVADVSSFLRLAVTGRLASPDLYAVMEILGKDRVEKRIKDFKESL